MPRLRRGAAGPDGRKGASLKPHRIGAVVACVVVVALLAVLPVFVNSAIGYVPLVAVVLALVLDAVYLAVLKRSVSFDGSSAGEGCTRGESLQFPLAVANRSVLPAPRIDALFYISDVYGDGGQTQVRRLTLPPRSDNVFDLGVRFDHIGTVQVGIRQVGLFSLLGVFSSIRDNDQLQSVQILPRVVDIASMEISDYSLREAQTNIKSFINDGMDYAGIRDYRWGDPMKSIHWKLSSKADGTYYTRLYETATAPGLAIFMDFECGKDDAGRMMDIYDAVIESALSIELHAAQCGYDTELLFVDRRGAYQRIEGPVGNRYGDFMRHVPRMSEGEGLRMQGLLLDEARSATCQNNLIVCTANVTDALVDALARIKSPLHSPLLVAVVPAPDDGQPGEGGSGGDEGEARRRTLRRLAAAGVPFALVSDASDMKAQVG